mgnify:FL=1
MVSACMLIRTERGRFVEVVDTLKQFKEAKAVFSVLGRYDAVVDIIADDYKNLGEVALRMGRVSGVVFTETLVEIEAGGI